MKEILDIFRIIDNLKMLKFEQVADPDGNYFFDTVNGNYIITDYKKWVGIRINRFEKILDKIISRSTKDKEEINFKKVYEKVNAAIFLDFDIKELKKIMRVILRSTEAHINLRLKVLWFIQK